MAWELKQEQLEDLHNILTHENFTSTGLDTEVETECAGLGDYIAKANTTAWDEKEELDQHVQETKDLKVRLDTYPCPCELSEWSEWSSCSVTCEEGTKSRSRYVMKNATNGGPECEGPHDQGETCNMGCCRK